MRNLIIILLLVPLTGCASVSMLPQNSREVEFGGGPEGKTGWSSYREEATFRNVDKDTLIEAAKVGLGNAGFSLRKVDKVEGIVFGEHGMTLHDWNVIAGVYIKEKDADGLVVVLVEGSKDIGFSGDVTGGAWTGRILNSMRHYLKEYRDQ